MREVMREVMELCDLEGSEDCGRIQQNLAELYNERQVAVLKSSTYLKTVVIYYKLYDLA